MDAFNLSEQKPKVKPQNFQGLVGGGPARIGVVVIAEIHAGRDLHDPGEIGPGGRLVVCLSGRGDKNVQAVAEMEAAGRGR